MKNFKCYKCSKCGKRVFFPFYCLPKPQKYEICCCCGEKVFMKRDRMGDIYSLFIQFINFVLRIFRNILDFWWIFAIIIGIFWFVFGLMYSVVSFNKHSCDRIHEITGYEINFDFYGGCFIKKNGEWFSYDKYMKVDVIKWNTKKKASRNKPATI